MVTRNLVSLAQEDPFGQSSYTFDQVRNRSERVQGTPGTLVTTDYSYDKADHITGVTGWTYTVNANGNLTDRVSASPSLHDTFTYDQANRLTEGSIDLGGGTSRPTTSSYNGDGLRVTKGGTGGVSVRYDWDLAAGLPVLLADYDSTGTLQRTYVYGPSGLTYNVSGTGAIEVYHKDHLGSIRELTDGTVGNAQVTTIYLTDEYGVPTITSAPVGQQPSTQPFRFTGELYDGDTGGPQFLYLRTRYYDPGTGRFISSDPLAGRVTEPETLHRYSYTGNNPLNRTDPWGLCAEGLLGVPWVDAGAGAAVTGFGSLALSPFNLGSPPVGFSVQVMCLPSLFDPFGLSMCIPVPVLAAQLPRIGTSECEQACLRIMGDCLRRAEEFFNHVPVRRAQAISECFSAEAVCEATGEFGWPAWEPSLGGESVSVCRP
jgi:RHS repeat-associated protein